MTRHWRTDERGSVLLFTTVFLAILVAVGGIAIDLAYQFSARGELQRSMDAASLAGAGKLGFDNSVFPTVRQFAQEYALKNQYRNPYGGTMTLSLNTANDPAGDIVLGTWQNGTFTASLDGSQVNAVLCRWSTTIPTSFLGILGFSSLPVSAYAIAIANPPNNPPPNTPLFPIGVTQCAFENAGVFSSQGCGAAITLISSSGQTPGTTAGTNTAAWVNLSGTQTPSAPTTSAAIDCAASGGSCTSSYSSLSIGTQVGANNGMQQSVFNTLDDWFIQQYNSSPVYDVYKTLSDGTKSATPIYEGHGWQVVVPVIQTPCPPQAINGTLTIVGWTRMVITQVIDKGLCAVNNPADAVSAGLCPPPNGTSSTTQPNLRAVFGYYDCGKLEGNPTPFPSPTAALAEHVRLVAP